MALFGRKKKEEAAEPVKAPKVAEKKTTVVSSGGSDLSHIIISPRISEKATDVAAKNVYTFDIAQGANKTLVSEAVKKLFKVTPRKVTIVNTPKKQTRSMRSGIVGMRAGGKKAYVYLKEGDSITLA